VIGLDDAGQMLGMGGYVAGALQEGDEFGYSVGGVGHACRRHSLARVVDNDGVMMIVRPVDANKPHNLQSLSRGIILGGRCPYTVALEARLSIVDSPQEWRWGRSICVKRSSR